MKDFSKDRGVAGAFFRRLEDHRIAARKRWRDFQSNLIEWPIPRRDHANDADGFINDRVCAVLFAKCKILERCDGAKECAQTGWPLSGSGKADWRAHFIRHGFGNIGNALFIFLDDATKQFEPFFAGGLAEGNERFLRGGDGGINICGGAHRDFGTGFFS